MNETKHTTGPWRAVGVFVITDNGPDICSTADVNNLPVDEATANACLIAAAPAMLTTLKEVLKDAQPTGFSVLRGGRYLGMFKIHGNRLEDVQATIALAEKG